MSKCTYSRAWEMAAPTYFEGHPMRETAPRVQSSQCTSQALTFPAEPGGSRSSSHASQEVKSRRFVSLEGTSDVTCALQRSRVTASSTQGPQTSSDTASPLVRPAAEGDTAFNPLNRSFSFSTSPLECRKFPAFFSLTDGESLADSAEPSPSASHRDDDSERDDFLGSTPYCPSARLSSPCATLGEEATASRDNSPWFGGLDEDQDTSRSASLALVDLGKTLTKDSWDFEARGGSPATVLAVRDIERLAGAARHHLSLVKKAGSDEGRGWAAALHSVHALHRIHSTASAGGRPAAPGSPEATAELFEDLLQTLEAAGETLLQMEKQVAHHVRRAEMFSARLEKAVAHNDSLYAESEQLERRLRDARGEVEALRSRCVALEKKPDYRERFLQSEQDRAALERQVKGLRAQLEDVRVGAQRQQRRNEEIMEEVTGIKKRLQEREEQLLVTKRSLKGVMKNYWHAQEASVAAQALDKSKSRSFFLSGGQRPPPLHASSLASSGAEVASLEGGSPPASSAAGPQKCQKCGHVSMPLLNVEGLRPVGAPSATRDQRGGGSSKEPVGAGSEGGAENARKVSRRKMGVDECLASFASFSTAVDSARGGGPSSHGVEQPFRGEGGVARRGEGPREGEGQGDPARRPGGGRRNPSRVTGPEEAEELARQITSSSSVSCGSFFPCEDASRDSKKKEAGDDECTSPPEESPQSLSGGLCCGCWRENARLRRDDGECAEIPPLAVSLSPPAGSSPVFTPAVSLRASLPPPSSPSAHAPKVVPLSRRYGSVANARGESAWRRLARRSSLLPSYSSACSLPSAPSMILPEPGRASVLSAFASATLSSFPQAVHLRGEQPSPPFQQGVSRSPGDIAEAGDAASGREGGLFAEAAPLASPAYCTDRNQTGDAPREPLLRPSMFEELLQMGHSLTAEEEKLKRTLDDLLSAVAASPVSLEDLASKQLSKDCLLKILKLRQQNAAKNKLSTTCAGGFFSPVLYPLFSVVFNPQKALHSSRPRPTHRQLLLETLKSLPTTLVRCLVPAAYRSDDEETMLRAEAELRGSARSRRSLSSKSGAANDDVALSSALSLLSLLPGGAVWCVVKASAAQLIECCERFFAVNLERKLETHSPTEKQNASPFQKTETSSNSLAVGAEASGPEADYLSRKGEEGKRHRRPRVTLSESDLSLPSEWVQVAAPAVLGAVMTALGAATFFPALRSSLPHSFASDVLGPRLGVEPSSPSTASAAALDPRVCLGSFAL
ncbi:hypothetical protein BESB_053930 [Besnoitia besnoiti]|uniref:Uncharacterized protein n=1 Tax=Besnoitia besnoiti TaxID=94643 RepID=A0A2A9MK17_BESBE|nr:hypothetical protein BESB_053930 [Besnoitia besnoiti]PFH35742.1 hypothetical protein BESB_053930 [Besnoitia besnoiti]